MPQVMNSPIVREPCGLGCRTPPEGWEKALAKLARERGGELMELADELAPK